VERLNRRRDRQQRRPLDADRRRRRAGLLHVGRGRGGNRADRRRVRWCCWCRATAPSRAPTLWRSARRRLAAAAARAGRRDVGVGSPACAAFWKLRRRMGSAITSRPSTADGSPGRCARPRRPCRGRRTSCSTPTRAGPRPASLGRQVDGASLASRAPSDHALAPDFRASAGVSGDGRARLGRGLHVIQPDHPRRRRPVRSRAMVAARMAAEPTTGGDDAWLRASADPWTDWFRFRHGVSFMYGIVRRRRSAPDGCPRSGRLPRRPSTSSCTRPREINRAPSSSQASRWPLPGRRRGARRAARGARTGGAPAPLTFYARSARPPAGGFERHRPRAAPRRHLAGPLDLRDQLKARLARTASLLE
jgi:hypothetical protein